MKVNELRPGMVVIDRLNNYVDLITGIVKHEQSVDCVRIYSIWMKVNANRHPPHGPYFSCRTYFVTDVVYDDWTLLT